MALYIHIPFCRRRCRYCAFVSYQGRQADIPAYLAALRTELARSPGDGPLGSIYLGGGTPSLLTAGQVADLFSTASSRFTVSKTAEITLEANPGTVDRGYLAALRRLGVNRLSLGVQSLDDGELAMLGRIHTAAEARQAVGLAREAGFDNLNLDLIYGLPGQTLAVWRHTLAGALELAPEHLSLYALSLEEGTPLHDEVGAGHRPTPDPDLAADQYQLAEDVLADHGYRHYEISNWAREGRQCRHNLTYWRNRPYIGVGVAAHSYRDGHRRANTADLDAYLAAFSGGPQPVVAMDEAIGPELERAETVILGLRLCHGIRLTRQLAPYRRPVAEMTGAGLLERAGGYLRLTRRGRLLSNEVFWRLLPEEA